MSGESKPKMSISSLHERHVGLTPALSEAFSEAASVCLNRHHVSPVELWVSALNVMDQHLVEFSTPDKRTLNAWANELDTTENGAYCVCLAAVEATENLIAVRRAETLTGADWYVAPVGTEPEDLEACFRLEVSGVDSGNKAIIDARLRKKVEQTKKGKSNVPAIASVVGFKDRIIAIQKIDEIS